MQAELHDRRYFPGCGRNPISGFGNRIAGGLAVGPEHHHRHWRRDGVPGAEPNVNEIFGKARLFARFPATLVGRLSQDKHRPLLQQGTEAPEPRVTRLLEEREPIYMEAEVVVETGRLTPVQTVTEIIRNL